MTERPPISPAVMWHDVECGRYEADLALWRSLARAAAGPVLDVGAGTGRIALRLAQSGRPVVALDRDAELLAALAERAERARVQIETVVADASAFHLAGRDFALIAVPMQTIQLLPGRPEREGFFAAARRALAESPEAFEDATELPLPDLGERGGWRFVSQPLAIRVTPDVVRIDRVRQLIAPDGTRTTTDDVVELAVVTADELAEEAAPHGLAPEPSRFVPATADHVGSEVVMLRG
jgi:SAM-dependent methyltransferase